MGFFLVKKPRFIFVVFLALSVTSAFTSAAADIPSLDFREGKQGTGGSITNIDAGYTIDCLPAARTTWASLPSRKSARFITPFGTFYADIVIPFSIIKITQPTKTLNAKNTILLKLRI